MFFSKIMDLDKKGITTEIANLDYSVELQNGIKFHLKEGDLVSFIRKYIPEIDLDEYLKMGLKQFQYKQAVELCYFLRYKIDDVFKSIFCFQLFDLYFDPKETDDIDSFNEMKSNDNFEAFFTACKNAFSELANGQKSKITRAYVLEKTTWVLGNTTMYLEDTETAISIKNDSLIQIIEHVKNDFKVNGENTLNALADKKWDSYVSVDFFLNNFEKDLQDLEADLSYVNLCNFLHKYKLPARLDNQH